MNSKFLIGQGVKINDLNSLYHDYLGIITHKHDDNKTYTINLFDYDGDKFAVHENHLVLADERLIQEEIKKAKGEFSSPYHVRNIPEGVYGESSKIFEELEEFKDAVEQQNPVLELCELCDILGAIGGYTEKKYNINIDQLLKMTLLTRKAFESGAR